MINIETAFATSSKNISTFFQRPGISYYIPLYQRPYSWDKDNIKKLMDDIVSGVIGLNNSTSNESIRFLGTIILVKEQHPQINIQPQDPQGLPPTIYNVIDGQQRISTIALLACLLYKRIYNIRNLLPDDGDNSDIRESSSVYLSKLESLFSVDLLMGKPTRKPIIIRGSEDKWTLNGDDQNYSSDIASFLAKTIRTISNHSNNFPETKTGTFITTNINLINQEIDKIQESHLNNLEDDIFPPAWDIINKFTESDLWSYNRPKLINQIEGISRNSNINKHDGNICSLVQLFAFCNFLLNRCCLTEIVPISETWAFDMFQSLNATGTPLTAIETFKPLILSFFRERYKDSIIEDYFNNIDSLFINSRNALEKSKITDDYLTLFALVHNGKAKLSSRFSEQRDWLKETFDLNKDESSKSEYLRQMSDLALYLKRLYGYNPNVNPAFIGLESLSQELKSLSGISLLYLQDANHKMAHSVLSRFYSGVINNEQNAGEEFAKACISLAAFFTLWRSSLPNAGLDDEYRNLMKTYFSWNISNNQNIKSNELKIYLKQVLAKRKIGTFDEWSQKALLYLRYNNAKHVCRFVLFNISHDTVEDPDNLGLMRKGTPGSSSYLDPIKWIENHCKSIEHVAPQQNNGSWDQLLYDDDSIHSIGNLILLPIEINSSIGNKGWIEKWIYYKFMAENDAANIQGLETKASNLGITLKKRSIDTLKNTPYQPHMRSIVNIGENGNWNKSLVGARTERICELLWERLFNQWLG